MSDAHLRDLERRWQQTGAAEDEATYLRAQLHAGGLAIERLRVAAHVGHEAALLALGEPAPAERPIGEWVSELQPLGGVEALRRAALAAARAAIDDGAVDEDRERTEEVWDASRVFVLCPCAPHVPFGMMILGRTPPETRLANALIGFSYPPHARSVVLCAVGLARAPRVREAIWLALTPWALDRGDPLREGWARPNARLATDRVLELVLEFTSGSYDPVGRLRTGVLDPGLLARVQAGSSPAEAVEAALRFVPAAQDTPELRDLMARLTRTSRPEDVPFAEFFATGWRSAPQRSRPDRDREFAGGQEFGIQF